MTKRRVLTLVLAAGFSARFGSTKLLHHLSGKRLIHYPLMAARNAKIGDVCLVTGHDRSAIESACSGMADLMLHNPDYKSGIGSSIACGVRTYRTEVDAIVVLLGDQPLITGEHLQTLVSHWSGSDTEIVASRFGDVDSPPILLPRNAFQQLSELDDDHGAQKILRDPRYTVIRVQCLEASRDIDTPEDLRDLLRNGTGELTASE